MAKHISGHSAASEGVERLRDAGVFHVFPAELDLVYARRADTHKLGLALHIGFLRLSVRLLDAKRMVSATLWRHLGAQLGVASPELASLKALYGERPVIPCCPCSDS